MFKKKVKLRVHNPECDPRQDSFNNGNWIDLAVSENVWMKASEEVIITTSKGEKRSIQHDFKYLPLGVSMTLPKWYKAEIKPRSSLYKKFKIIQTNSIGEIEWDFSQIWMFPALAFEKAHIPKASRICQFQVKLREDAPWWAKILDLFTSGIKFEEVNVITTNRGGLGSTGTRAIPGVNLI